MIAIAVYVENLVQHGDILLQMKWRPKVRPLPFRGKTSQSVEIHSCAECGSTTHFTLTPAYKLENPSVDQIGVNMRLFDHEQLCDVEVQYPNGSEWSGKGPFEFRREPITLNPDSPW